MVFPGLRNVWNPDRRRHGFLSSMNPFFVLHGMLHPESDCKEAMLEAVVAHESGAPNYSIFS